MAVMVSVATAQKTKHLESWADVKPGDAIALEEFRGADLVIRTWDRPKVEVRLNIRFESSSEEEEQEYVDEVRIERDLASGSVVFRLNQPSSSKGLTLKNLLHLRFSTYIKKEIRGEVFLPKENAFRVEAKYGKLDLEGIDGPVEVESQSNLVDIRSCSQLVTVKNNYGTTVIDKCGGKLSISNKSGKVNIDDFTGSLNIDAKYSTITVDKVSNMVDIESQSGSVMVKNAGEHVIVNAPYSTITVEKVKGSATIIGKSGSVGVSDVIGLKVDAPYSTIEAQDVTGNGAAIITGQSGKISLARIASAVDIQSPYTNIDLSDIVGEVRLGTKSGNVRASRVRGNWTSLTEYTRLTISDLQAPNVLIENKNGGIEVGLTTIPKSVEIVNSYGDVNLKLPRGLNADVRLNAEYGTISSGIDVAVEKIESGAIALGKVGSGAGTLSIETKSGNIRIQEK